MVRRRTKQHATLLADEAEDGRHLVAVAARDRGLGLAVADDAAFEVLAQDEVDHAADRVGAVDRGGTVGQHFDALDRQHRDRVQVGSFANVWCLGHATAIHQHQGTARTQAAQVGFREALRAAAALRAEVAEGRKRQRTNELGDGDRARGFELLTVDDRDRQRAFGIRTLDARTRDLDALGILRHRGQGRDRDGAAEGQQHTCGDFRPFEHEPHS